MNLTLPESPNGDLNTIDRMWLDFKSASISFVDCHAQFKKINGCLRGIYCPWMNGKIKKVMYERNKQS